MNKIETRWLDYARDVLMRSGGAMNCCVSGDTDRVSRWPGYLGPEYANGRVLFVGAVHNQEGMDSAPGIPEIGAAAKEWIRGDRSDSEYLALLRAEYPATVEYGGRHGASVFAKFASIRANLTISLEQSATTNIAKCTAVTGSTKYGESILACPMRFPLADLISRLDPVLVFIACNDSKARLTDVENTSSRRVYRFHQRNSLEYATGRRLEVWLPEAAAFYRAARRPVTTNVTGQAKPAVKVCRP
jgi:hypothetical protein